MDLPLGLAWAGAMLTSAPAKLPALARHSSWIPGSQRLVIMFSCLVVLCGSACQSGSWTMTGIAHHRVLVSPCTLGCKRPGRASTAINWRLRKRLLTSGHLACHLAVLRQSWSQSGDCYLTVTCCNAVRTRSTHPLWELECFTFCIAPCLSSLCKCISAMNPHLFPCYSMRNLKFTGVADFITVMQDERDKV